MRRRSLPTIRQHWPLWQRLAFDLVRLVVVAWAQHRRRCVVEEERGYRCARRINGSRIGPNYLQNCQAQRRQFRAIVSEWTR